MKRSIYIGLLIIVLLAIGYFGTTLALRHKIELVLKEQVQKERLTYADFHFNVLTSTFSIDSLTYYPQHSNDTLFAEEIVVSGLSYAAYIFQKDIALEEIKLKHPVFSFHKTNSSKKKNKQSKAKFIDKTIRVDQLEIQHGQLDIREDKQTKFQLKDFSLKLNAVKVTPKTLKQTLPFNYDTYSFQGKALFYHLNKLQHLKIDHFKIKTHHAVFHDIELLPNYSREKYINVIPFEKDLVNLKISSLRLNDYKLSLKHSGKFVASSLKLDSVNAEIYRNKQIADNPKTKKMYSQMLRELPFKLNIDTFKIRHAYLSYEEVQEKTGETGKVFFKNMKVTGTSLTNIKLDRSDFPKTKVDISCAFMGVSPLDVTWQFRVNSPTDQFTIKGQCFNIPPKAINSFFVPAFYMKVTGNPLEGLFFNFYGNNQMAHGEFLMKYEGLKIVVLNKNGEKKNKIISFLANLFVNHKNSKNNKQVQISQVKRDKQRSFWNYFWNCIFSGLKKTML